MAPSPEGILNGLTVIANEWASAAVVWHLAFAGALVALLCGWRPSNRVGGYLLAAPFLTVSTAAWVSGNPFNATVFAALLLALTGAARRLSNDHVRVAPPKFFVPGALLVAFGWGYPHFLETDSWMTYLYAAPLGLLPCPTLSAAIGVTLMLSLLASRPWSIALALAGLIYGAVGVFVLGVQLDYLLLAGAVALVAAVRTWTPVSSTRARRQDCNEKTLA